MSDNTLVNNEDKKVEVEIIGDHECPVCEDTLTKTEELEKKKPISKKFIDIDSPEARTILEEEGFNLDKEVPIPFIRKCDVTIDKETGQIKKKENCSKYSGQSEEYFNSLADLPDLPEI